MKEFGIEAANRRIVRTVTTAAPAPVLPGIAHTALISPEERELSDPFLLLSGVGCQTPIWTCVDDRQSVNTVAVTELVLDSGMFDHYLTPWPVCPVHPSGSHSLRPVARGE